MIIAVILMIGLLIWSIKAGEDYRKNVTDKCTNCGQPDALININKEFLSSEKDWKKEYDYKEKKEITVSGYIDRYRITRQCRYCGYLKSEERAYFRKA